MIEFGSNKVRSIRDYCISSLMTAYNRDEAAAITYSLFEHILGYKKHQVEINGDSPLNESTIVEFVHALKRLKKHEPLQYIFNKAWFRDLELYVDPSVLIPRPETEELVEAIISETEGRPSLSVLDICTGSGCIAIALQKELTSPRVVALDISADAINVAKKNATKHKSDIEFLVADILSDNDSFKSYTFDIIVSNPPYVTRSEAEHMQKNVLDYEPGIALFVSDNDPLLFYRKIAVNAKKWLRHGGKLFFEINESLGNELLKLLQSFGFEDASIIKDISGKDRIVKATWNGSSDINSEKETL